MSTTFRTRACAAAAATVAVAALALAAPTAAVAHVTVDGSSTTPGSTSTLAFTIEHGCDGSPTTAVTIGVPDEIGGVTPIANAGWDVSFDLEGEGRTMTYTAQTPLPSAVHDTLELDVTLPDDVADGTVLAFPAEQTCEVGSESWASLEADAEAPAPTLVVAAPAVEEAPAAAPAATSALTVAALVAALAAAALATIALRRQQAKGGPR